MSLINNLKNIFGFSDADTEVEQREQEHERSPYINPFKEESPTSKQQSASLSPAIGQIPATPGSGINQKIIDKIIDVLNVSLPEYARECIDKDAQSQYVKKLIGESLDKYTAEIRLQAEESARLEWQSERMTMEQKVAAAMKQSSEAASKTEELKGRIMSLDRQKAALTERIASLDAKAETSEAEKEQYQLECKSLMNKLKVSAVNEAELTSAKEECAALQTDNSSLKAELLKLRADAENLRNTVEAESEKKLEELTNFNQELSDRNKELSDKIKGLESTASDANGDKAIDALQAEITHLNNKIQKYKEAEAALAKATSAQTAEIEKHKAEISSKEKEISEMQTTITKQNDEIYSLNQRLNDIPESEGALQAAESERDALYGETVSLKKKLETVEIKLRDMTGKAEELSDVSEQLRNIIDSNKKLHSANEEKLQQEIALLRKENEQLKFDIKHKSEKKVIDLTPAKAERPAKHKIISAIDYTTEYTDWLMPTPPSASIPIENEGKDDSKKLAKEPKTNPNAPSQMELFS